MIDYKTTIQLAEVLKNRVSEVKESQDLTTRAQNELLSTLKSYFDKDGQATAIFEAQKLLGDISPDKFDLRATVDTGKSTIGVLVTLNEEGSRVTYRVAGKAAKMEPEELTYDQFLNCCNALTPKGVENLSKAIDIAMRKKLEALLQRMP